MNLIKIALLVGGALPSLSQAETLRVAIENVTKAKGSVIVSVYQGPQSYGNGKNGSPDLVLVKAASLSPMTFEFHNVQSDTVLVSVLHDRNDNKKMDTNFVGMPKEPYGFSNNARGRFGPISYEQGAVSMDSELVAVSINLD